MKPEELKQLTADVLDQQTAEHQARGIRLGGLDPVSILQSDLFQQTAAGMVTAAVTYLERVGTPGLDAIREHLGPFYAGKMAEVASFIATELAPPGAVHPGPVEPDGPLPPASVPPAGFRVPTVEEAQATVAAQAQEQAQATPTDPQYHPESSG